jgi:hypothetical protein
LRFMTIRRFGVVGLIAGAAILTLSVSTEVAAQNPSLVITKECSEFSGKTPSFCTILTSNLPAIPPGSRVYYYGPEFTDPDYTSSWVILQTPVQANRATGYCSLLGNDGNCSFFKGTGTLTDFHAAVQVSVPTPPGDHFLWEGTYRFDPHH